MAQKSKKHHILEVATREFLAHGFRGTSIDQVVKASGVSKPTLYNHFADKSALFSVVIEDWIGKHKPAIQALKDPRGLEKLVESQWLNNEAVRVYAMVMGEGVNFPETRDLFWNRYDGIWRKAFVYLCGHSIGIDQQNLDQYLDHQLVTRLRDL